MSMDAHLPISNNTRTNKPEFLVNELDSTGDAP